VLSAEFLEKYGRHIPAVDGEGLESAPDMAGALASAMDAHGGAVRPQVCALAQLGAGGFPGIGRLT
jgi:hypothetical protein